MAASTLPTCGGSDAAKDALRFIRADGTVEATTYAQLAERTDRFASVLRGLGISRAERVFSLLGRRPELYVAALGTLKNAKCVQPALLGATRYASG